jgi:hypothetical protein
MMWVPATEAVAIVVAKMMTWMLAAETTQVNQLQAKAMTRLRATETAPVNGLKQSFGAAPTISEEQLLNCDGRGWRHDDKCARGSRGQTECSENDAVQQHAVDRSKSGHGSPPG